MTEARHQSVGLEDAFESVGCLNIVYQESAGCLNTVYQESVGCLNTVYQESVGCLNTVYQESVGCLNTVYQESVCCLNTVYQESAGGLSTVCQENKNSEQGANAILNYMRAESNCHACPEKTVQDVREGWSCFRTMGDKQSVRSVDTRRNLSFQVPSATSESTVLSPACQGDVNNVICDGTPVQYCYKPNCQYKTPALYNTHPICDKPTSSYQKGTAHPQRCARLEHHNLQTYISSQDFRHISKNITRHSWHKINVKQFLLTLILQTCINSAVGKDVPVIEPATYQPCLIARSSSHLIYERHPNNCSVFYMCHGSSSWPMSCTQENTVFSVKHKVCVWRNSNFDDCHDKFANIKKDSLQESNLPSLTETQENNGQIKDGDSLTDTFLHENYNHKNGNGLKTLKSQNRGKQVIENVDHIYTPSQKINQVESIPKYSGQSLFPVNEIRVHRKLQTQKRVSGTGHDPVPLGTKEITGKSKNDQTKLIMERTALNQNDDLTLVDSKETAPEQDTVHENDYFSTDNYVDNTSEGGDIEDDNSYNAQNNINEGWNVEKTGRVGFDNKNHLRTITQTSIKEKLVEKKKHDTFDQTSEIDSTTHQPIKGEHLETITEIYSEEHSTPSSFYDYFDERTTEPVISYGFKKHKALIVNERNAERRIKSPNLYTSTKRTLEFHGFYKYTDGVGDFSINEDNAEITALPLVTDENTAITLSALVSYPDSILPSSLDDDYVDTTEVPSSTNEHLDQSIVTREKFSYPFNDEDSGKTRESVDKINVLKRKKNADTSRSIPGITWYDKSEENDARGNMRIDETTNNVYEDWSQEVEEDSTKTSDKEAKHGSSFSHVQAPLKKDYRLQDGKETSLQTSSYGQNVIEPLHLGKSWLKRQHERQTPLTTDRRTEMELNISTGKQVVHLNDDDKNPSNSLRFQDKTAEEHFSTADENYGRRKTLKFDDTDEENQFPKSSQNVRESYLHYSSLLRDKKSTPVHTKVPITGYNDKQTKQNKDDKANGSWYVINNGLGTQSTEDKKQKLLTPDMTQSTKTEFVDNSRKFKSRLIVQPWPQLTHKLHNKQTGAHNAIDNLRLMETFLRMLNITVHRHDVPVKDVPVNYIRTTKTPRLYLTPTILPKQQWTTERPAPVLTHLPPYKPSQDDFKIPTNQKDSTLKGLIPKVQYDGQESLKNNGRVFEDGELTGYVLKKETQYRDTLSQNENIPRNLLVQQNQNQENWNKQKQRQNNQYSKNQHQHKQQHQYQQNQNQQNQQNQNQQNKNQQNHNKNQQNQNQPNQDQQNRNQQNENQQNENQQNQNQQNQNQQNENQQNQNQQNKNQQNLNKNQQNQNKNQQNQNEQNQYQQNQNQQHQNQKQNQNPQNQYQQNQYQHKQNKSEQTQLEHLQNRTLNKILRNGLNENQRSPNTTQHSSPQLWEVKVGRPWFETLLNKDKKESGHKKLFDQHTDENNKHVRQLDKVKQHGFQISDHRPNYSLDRFRKQRKLNFGPNGKHDSKMEQNIKRGIHSKREDKNNLDNDLKRNILLLQNENLQKHKQLLLDIRNKTSKKLLKIKMDQISNFYTENDIGYESSDYEDADFSFMAQPVPINPLPRPTKASTTTTTSSQTTTTRSEDRKLPHSFDSEHVPTYRKQLKDRCGIMATPLIIGGQRSRRGQWPWQASLQIVTSTTPWHRCGAVLVHPKWVLTAAHCMEGSFYGETSNWRVVLADYNLETVSGNEIYRDVVRVISHPGYLRTSNFPNDVALLELDSPVDMTSGDVQTACMPDSDFPLVPGMKCWISGWGETRGTGGQENTMNEVKVDVLPHDQCKSMWGKVNIDVLDSQVCLGHGQTGACYGDSGGPLMCESEGRFYVAGVMSWLINNCSATNFPNVFTRLPNFTEWLYKELDYFEWMRHL